MQAQVDARVLDQIKADPFPSVGVKGHGVDDGLRHPGFVEVDAAPAGPLLPHVPIGQAVLRRRIDRAVLLDHPVDIFADDAGGDDLIAFVDHVVEHQNHAARGHAAKVVVALQQGH